MKIEVGMSHTVRVNSAIYYHIESGVMSFLPVQNDNNFQRGDFIYLYEKDGTYGTPGIKFRVVYIYSGHGVEKDHVILGLERYEE